MSAISVGCLIPRGSIMPGFQRVYLIPFDIPFGSTGRIFCDNWNLLNLSENINISEFQYDTMTRDSPQVFDPRIKCLV